MLKPVGEQVTVDGEFGGEAQPGIREVAVSLKNFDIIPAISIRRGRIVQAKGNKYQVLRLRGVVPHPLDLMDILYETFETILVLDLDGIFKNKPAIGLYRKIAQLGDFWVDGGARHADTVIDLLMGGPQYAVLGTKTLEGLDELQEAFELSENIIFGLDYNKGILSPDEKLQGSLPAEIMRRVRDMGIEKCLFADLGRVDKDKNLEMDLIRILKGTGLDIYVGGGIKSQDINALRGLNVNGAIVEIGEVLNNPKVFSLDPELLDEIAPEGADEDYQQG
jgi:phosphoribosylformimino-5-aminoimidazole carboxamide ribonucleotide (ProFAR) isomerase